MLNDSDVFFNVGRRHAWREKVNAKEATNRKEDREKTELSIRQDHVGEGMCGTKEKKRQTAKKTDV